MILCAPTPLTWHTNLNATLDEIFSVGGWRKLLQTLEGLHGLRCLAEIRKISSSFPQLFFLSKRRELVWALEKYCGPQ